MVVQIDGDVMMSQMRRAFALGQFPKRSKLHCRRHFVSSSSLSDLLLHEIPSSVDQICCYTISMKAMKAMKAMKSMKAMKTMKAAKISKKPAVNLSEPLWLVNSKQDVVGVVFSVCSVQRSHSQVSHQR